ncbi:MAG: recombinase family protein [Pseudomonadota bacterium]
MSGLHWFALVTACQVACLPGGSDRGVLCRPSRRRLLRPGFQQIVVYRDSDDAQSHPQLDRLLQMAAERKIALIVVNTIGDLARAPGQLVEVLGRLMELGVGLISRQEGIDTTIDAAVLTKVVTAVVEMRRGAMLSMVTTRRKGQPGRPETEVDVEEARRLRAEGLSYGQIAAVLKVPKGTVHGRLKGKV